MYRPGLLDKNKGVLEDKDSLRAAVLELCAGGLVARGVVELDLKSSMSKLRGVMGLGIPGTYPGTGTDRAGIGDARERAEVENEDVDWGVCGGFIIAALEADCEYVWVGVCGRPGGKWCPKTNDCERRCAGIEDVGDVSSPSSSSTLSSSSDRAMKVWWWSVDTAMAMVLS